MTATKYVYQRAGGPILDWRNGVPRQSRAADAVSLGSLAGTTLDDPTLVLPAPGAPEPVGISRGALSGCGGGCGCAKCGGLSGVADSVPGGYVTLGVAAYLLWKLLRKKR
jgi:hypothetical protein